MKKYKERNSPNPRVMTEEEKRQFFRDCEAWFYEDWEEIPEPS